jgi:hypothetical protein
VTGSQTVETWSPVTQKPDLAAGRAACERLLIEAASSSQPEATTASSVASEEAAWRQQSDAQLQRLLGQLSQLLHTAGLVHELPACLNRCRHTPLQKAMLPQLVLPAWHTYPQYDAGMSDSSMHAPGRPPSMSCASARALMAAEGS